MDNKITFTLRIDEDIMEELRKIAESHSRSVNKELEFLIKNYIEEVNNNEKNN